MRAWQIRVVNVSSGGFEWAPWGILSGSISKEQHEAHGHKNDRNHRRPYSELAVQGHPSKVAREVIRPRETPGELCSKEEKGTHAAAGNEARRRTPHCGFLYHLDRPRMPW
ncbi:MAG: hypothetical protein AAF355_06910 [Myxococcota bacterium]